MGTVMAKIQEMCGGVVCAILALPLASCVDSTGCDDYRTPREAIKGGHTAVTAQVISVGEDVVVVDTTGGINYGDRDFVGQRLHFRRNDCMPTSLEEGAWVAVFTETAKGGSKSELVPGTPGLVPIASATSPLPREWQR